LRCLRRRLGVRSPFPAAPYLPRVLARRLAQAGFEVTRIDVIPLLNARYDADAYSAGLIDVIHSLYAQADRRGRSGRMG